MSGAVLRAKDDVLRFMLAGKAIMTLKSLRTGQHFTYKVKKAQDWNGIQSKLSFVSVLNGPDNTTNYSYMGTITPKLDRLCTSAKSRVGSAAPSFKAFAWFLQALAAAGDLPADLEVRHEGRCGKCGRLLTHPESIDRGIGPECWGKMFNRSLV